jgi:hypothetical protein
VKIGTSCPVAFLTFYKPRTQPAKLILKHWLKICFNVSSPSPNKHPTTTEGLWSRRIGKGDKMLCQLRLHEGHMGETITTRTRFETSNATECFIGMPVSCPSLQTYLQMAVPHCRSEPRFPVLLEMCTLATTNMIGRRTWREGPSRSFDASHENACFEYSPGPNSGPTTSKSHGGCPTNDRRVGMSVR